MYKLLFTIMFVCFTAFVTSAQTSCPNAAAITTNGKCVFLSWDEVPMPMPATLLVNGATYTYDSGDGTTGSPAIFRDGTPGGGACNANQGTLFEGNIVIDGNPCEYISGSLGVEWVAFKAEPSRSMVLLRWFVISDEQSSMFEVERSKDLQSWSKIGELKSIPNLELAHYTFSDRSVANGTYYYRIREIDIDGHSKFSPIARVEVHLTADIKIRYRTSSSEIAVRGVQQTDNAKVVISTLSGYEIFQDELNGSVHEDTMIFIPALPSGIYLVTVIGPDLLQTEKIYIP